MPWRLARRHGTRELVIPKVLLALCRLSGNHPEQNYQRTTTTVDVRTILILGGYGNFGKRIASHLSQSAGLTLLIGGRDASKAASYAAVLQDKAAPDTRIEPCKIDYTAEGFPQRLRLLAPQLVIHTSGPFQGQDYRVPEACIACGAHYIDLADDRRFVCDIDTLNTKALEAKVLVVSGASSVPGLSSVVVDHFLPQFQRLDTIDFAIAPGNQAERGEATLRGILSYTGHAFPVWQQGRMTETFGWMAPRYRDFGGALGKRWLADIDIPDLELFPKRYPTAQTVRFQAGLELPLLHFGMVGMAWLARLKLIPDWSVFTRPIWRASEWFKRFGSGDGGMQISLMGIGHDNAPLTIHWTLTALNGAGPYIPTMSALILADKLVRDTTSLRGALPCLGLFDLTDFDRIAAPDGITHATQVIHG